MPRKAYYGTEHVFTSNSPNSSVVIKPGAAETLVVTGTGTATLPSFSLGATNTGLFSDVLSDIAFSVEGTRNVGISKIADERCVLAVNKPTNASVDLNGCAIEAAVVYPRTGINLVNTGAASHASTMIAFTNEGVAAGAISVTDATTSYATSSDRRLKDNIELCDDPSHKVMKIRPVKFKWAASKKEVKYGFVADELALLFPECVIGEKDRLDCKGNPVYQAVDASKLIPALVRVIQLQQERLEAIEEKINSTL